MVKKFWFFDYIDKQLNGLGINPNVINLFVFILITVVLIVIIKFFNNFIQKLVTKLVSHRNSKLSPSTKEFLIHSKLLVRVLNFLLVLVCNYLCRFLYGGFIPDIVSIMTHAFNVLTIFFFTLILMTVVDIVHKRISDKSGTQSMKGFVQTIKLVIWIIAAILCFTMITDTSISKMMTGIAAFAAVLMLVFKDPILGLVASVQITTNDSIRLNDWIQTSDNTANGIVKEVNLTYVKVLNWNNTTTFVPIYSLISQSYINWREMYDSNGRKFTNAQVVIDTNFVRLLTDEEVATLSQNELITPYYEKMTALCQKEKLTNLSLYRTYIECYLAARDDINSSIFNVMIYQPHQGEGITLTAYTYCTKTSYADFEHIQCNILEHMIATAPVFNIILCQMGTFKIPKA